MNHEGSGGLFGRDDDLLILRTMFGADMARLVTVTGRGGAGKTALAATFADQLRWEQPDLSVAIIRLESISNPATIPDLVAGAFGLITAVGTGEEALVSYFTERSALVVLDNMEHLLSGAAILARLLERSPTLQLLVTSQAPLRLRAERVMELRSLPVPAVTVIELADLAIQPAVALYCARAGAVNHRFVLDDANANAIGELCRRLEGLPLAIELAAARSIMLPAAAIVSRLDERPLELLRGPRPDVPLRQHDLRSALAWTVSLLSQRETDLFERLSVTVGPFGLDTVEALAVDTETAIDDLSALLDFHLVGPVAGPAGPWYSLPPTIAAFSHERLVESGKQEQVRRTHVEATAAWARVAALRAESAAEAAWFAEMEMRKDDVLSCLTAAIAFENAHAALDLLCVLGPWWRARGRDERDRMAMKAGLRLAAASGTRNASHASAIAWSVLLNLRERPPDATELDRQLADAESMARSCGETSPILRVLACRLLAAQFSADRTRASAAGDEGLRLAESVGEQRWIAQFQVWKGMLAHLEGDFPRAISLGLQGLAGARQVNSRGTIVLATMLLRPIMSHAEALDAGVPTSAEAMALTREAGDTTLIGILLTYATAETAFAGDLANAAAYSVEALTLAATAPHLVPMSLFATVFLLSVVGEHDSVVSIDAALTKAKPVLALRLPGNFSRLYERAVQKAKQALGSTCSDDACRRFQSRSLLEVTRDVASIVRRLPVSSPPVSSPPLPGPVAAAPFAALTERQLEVLLEVAAGHTNREIAIRLGMAPKTAMHHLSAVYRTIGVRSRSEATAWALRRGLLR